ncbi:MAG: esterase/lipase family protein [Acidimicrobiia bacterium]|jgi:pimeloyl-ACP methyl ester carboxylesterase
MRAHSTNHDHQPVLVLPGFLAHDIATTPLRMVIADRTYPVYGWHHGINIGPTKSVLAGLRKRIHELSQRHGVAVSVIGWSLGGLYARELAREFPGEIRQVITLGSPMNLGIGTPICSRTHALFERLRPLYSSELEQIGAPDVEKARLTVPATAVFTRGDEVVPWTSCIDHYGSTHNSENIEVRGTHIGLAQNHAVAHLVLDRLAQPEGAWTPFEPGAVHAHHYPSHMVRASASTLARGLS